MANLNTKEIAIAAAGAGFTGKLLSIMTAIAIAESSGDTDVVNPSTHVGLWQIGQIQWSPSHPQWTVEWLKFRANNAAAAKVVYDAQGLSAWSTYTNGAYKTYIDGANAATANLNGADIPYTTVNPSKPSSAESEASDGTTPSLDAEIGPPSGAMKKISPIYLKNTPTMGDFYLMGNKLEAHIQKSVISASAEFTTDLVSQVTVQVIDPGFKFLGSGLCVPGTPARLQNMNLVVASTETSSTAGNPIVTLKCRPKVVQDLKARQGSSVMDNASPSDFVKREVEAVGGYAYIQASPKRGAISRDIPEAGQNYDQDTIPSTWTTMQRLASELGFILFEENSTVFFGKPTYFSVAGSKIPLVVNYAKGDNKTRSLSIPECAKSLDSQQTTISVDLPLDRSFEARCGRTMRLGGVPEFDGDYLVSSVSYNLAGVTELMTVEAQTPLDPVAQPPGGDPAITGSLNDVGSTSDGSYPLPSQYKVTTAWGVPGNWQAGHHTGADYACPIGTPVHAVYDGEIVGISTWGAAYGNHIILQVGKKQYGFCHLSRILVSKGTTVKSGQVIGYSGNTGNTTGPHLHLELRHSPYKYGNDENPVPSLMKKGVSSGTSSIGTGKPGSKLAADFVYFAQTRAGGQYIYAAQRNPSNANQTIFDCSSLIQWAAYQVGITNIPGDTVSQTAFFDRKGGLKISLDKAIKTRGALLYKRTSGGKSDHVAISLGNGKTIEASSPSIGIGQQSATGRGFNVAYLLPGLRY